MIKLIASDMDGTLLDENSKLPKNFFETLDILIANKIKFAVASGRPYYTLQENFKPYSDKIYYICDNGAYIADGNKEISVSIIENHAVQAIVKKSLGLENTEIVLCGKKGAYHRPCSANFTKEINKYYLKKEIVTDFNNIDDEIFKITFCDLSGSKENSFKHLSPLFGEDFKVVVSGDIWLDITNKNINKGLALEKIQQAQNISYDETMAFGDFYNDIEMLEKAHYSFVMANANEDMKKYGNFTAESNKDNGVIKAIETYALNDLLKI